MDNYIKLNYRADIEELQKFTKALKNQIESYKQIINKGKYQFPDILGLIRDTLERTPKILTILAHCGWYTSWSMTPGETFKLANELEKGYYRKVDKFLIEHFKKDLPRIKKNLITNFPNRARIFKSAFRTQNNKDYLSSIPLFLSQAEGICIDLTGIKLYSTNHSKPKITKFVESLPKNELSSILLQPLLAQGLITANNYLRHNFPGTINRHEILHGISTDYGIQVNSYKAISWINYINEILHDAVILSKTGQKKA